MSITEAEAITWAARDPVEDFLTDPRFSEKTRETYRALLKSLQRFCETPIYYASLPELKRAFLKVREIYKPSSMMNVTGALRGLLVSVGRTEEARQFKYPNIRWMPRPPVMPGQIDEILEHADPAERTLILTFYSTGARVAELFGRYGTRDTKPAVNDFDRENGKIYITNKGGLFDELVFFPRRGEAVAALERHIGNRSDGPLFELSYKQARRRVIRAGRRVGIRLTPHMLRHAGATSLIMQGVATRVVQQWLRHRTLEMTERYTHVLKPDLIRLAQEREWR